MAFARRRPNGSIEWEADPRHAQILLSQLDLEKSPSKGQATPGVKVAPGEEWTLEAPLESPHKEVFRSINMRAAYLAQDRPELLFSSKECARVMHLPTQAGWNGLKRMGRFLKAYPRVVTCYEKQERPKVMKYFSDTDHAGCLITRRSTSSITVMHGKHWIYSSSTTQKGVSLSTGESEFHGIVKTGSFALGMKVLLEDWGVDIGADVFTDATAGKGIASRRGVGRVRHLHAPLLWIQAIIEKRTLALKKVDGKVNVADLGTKHVDGTTLWRLMQLMGLEGRDGKSKLALKAAV